jgi:DNA-binding NarL/FixJ family response regulator
MRPISAGAAENTRGSFTPLALPLTMRVLIADDFELMRDGIQSLILRQGWEVCGTAATGREAVEKAQTLRPDVAILDLTMPFLDGVEATRQIRQADLGTEVLILTAHEDDQPIRDALKAGAKGYLFKSEAAKQLVEGIEAIAAHQVFLSERASEVLFSSISRDAIISSTPLTARERQILQLVAEENSNKEIGEALGISSRTVEVHRLNIMRKVSADSVVGLIRYAIRNHMIPA